MTPIDLDANHRQWGSSVRKFQRLETRPNVHFLAAKVHGRRKEGDIGGGWINKGEVLGPFPSPKDEAGGLSCGPSGGIAGRCKK